ncbi:hypothetical protein [Micromonospora sp. KLBMP9576]|uniref:hypothetical protein n=1 Tax=Micromonospora sp. KLBMP9576 TaxID=3424769 RepID=UPI003D8BC42E
MSKITPWRLPPPADFALPVARAIGMSQWNASSRKAFTGSARQHLPHIVNINKIYDHEYRG